MTKQEAKKGPQPIPTPPTQPDTADELSPQQRAAACGAEVRDALARHGCRLQPFLRQEPVGTDGQKAIIQADVTIVPVQEG